METIACEVCGDDEHEDACDKAYPCARCSTPGVSDEAGDMCLVCSRLVEEKVAVKSALRELPCIEPRCSNVVTGSAYCPKHKPSWWPEPKW